MRFVILFLLSFLYISTTSAVTIQMFGQRENGFSQPRYIVNYIDKFDNNHLNLIALADDNNFPFSAEKQGSVFYKVFENLPKTAYTNIVFSYRTGKYEEKAIAFERGRVDNLNAHIGVYYQDMPYSINRYIYPAFVYNNIHIISTLQNKINITGKDNLKNFKGVRVLKDRVPDIVERDYKELNVKGVADYPAAFEELLTGKADYIAASYYPSLIEAYKLGIKDFIAYSQEPVWKLPLFIRVRPELMRHPRMENLVRYLKSSSYRKARDDAFAELIEFYKNNTQGVVPPTYISVVKEEPVENEENNATEPVSENLNTTEEQRLEK